MVIMFSDDRAFEQLRDRGQVVSFRERERKSTPRDGYQRTWCNRGRGTEKEFDVLVFHLFEMEPEEDPFEALWPMAGFPNKTAWLKAIYRLTGGVPPTGHFYYVVKAPEGEE